MYLGIPIQKRLQLFTSSHDHDGNVIATICMQVLTFFFEYCRIISAYPQEGRDLDILPLDQYLLRKGLNSINSAREAYSVCGKGNLLSIGCNKASSICRCSATSPPLNLLTFFILRLYSEPAIQQLSVWTEATW